MLTAKQIFIINYANGTKEKVNASDAKNAGDNRTNWNSEIIKVKPSNPKKNLNREPELSELFN